MKFKLLLLLLLIQLPFHFLSAQGTKAKSTTAATGSKDVKKKVTTKDDDYWANKYDEIKRILDGLPADEPKKEPSQAKSPNNNSKKD